MAKQAKKYRLEPVLKKREREKDAALQKVKDAKKAVEFEEQKLQKLLDMRLEIDRKKQACTDRFYELLGQPGTNVAYESEAHENYQKVLAEQARNHDQAIVRQKVTIEQAKERVKQAEQELLQATINVQAMEKHKEDWAKQVKLEELREEQERQEEIGEAMWLQHKRRMARE